MKTLPLNCWIGLGWFAANFVVYPGFSADPIVVTVPGGGPSGNSTSEIPFGGLLDSTSPQQWRYQQVYESSAFLPDVSQSGWISGIWFLSDPDYGRAWGAYLPKVEISMGLSAHGPDALRASFAENFLGEAFAVKPLSPLSIGSSGSGFRVFVPFSNPYLYDPARGDLLIEIKVVEPVCCFPGEPLHNAGPLDAWDVAGDAVSRVYARGDANAAIGTVDTVGLKTLFEVTVVPEPSTLAMLSAGLGLLGWRWQRRQARSTRLDMNPRH